jgi:hypothetical protein
VGQHAQLRPQQPHERVVATLDERDGGAQQREPVHPLGPAQADLQGHAAAHRVADQVRALHVQRVHHVADRLGEPLRGVGGQRRLRRGAEAGQVDRVDAVAAGRQRGRCVEERGLRRAQPVDAQDVVALAHAQGRDAPAGQLDVVHAQQRRAAGGQAEEPLEADRAVEVAARVEPPLPEGLDPGDVAAAQLQPGLGVGADHDVGPAAGDALANAGAMGGAADLPGVAHVAEAHVVGHVGAGVGSEVALRERPERVLHLLQAAAGPRHGGTLAWPSAVRTP